MLIHKLARMYAQLDTIPASAANRLIALLERAPDDMLALIVKHRVKFCWQVAGRILRDRARGKESCR